MRIDPENPINEVIMTSNGRDFPKADEELQGNICLNFSHPFCNGKTAVCEHEKQGTDYYHGIHAPPARLRVTACNYFLCKFGAKRNHLTAHVFEFFVMKQTFSH